MNYKIIDTTYHNSTNPLGFVPPSASRMDTGFTMKYTQGMGWDRYLYIIETSHTTLAYISDKLYTNHHTVMDKARLIEEDTTSLASYGRLTIWADTNGFVTNRFVLADDESTLTAAIA